VAADVLDARLLVESPIDEIPELILLDTESDVLI